MKGLMKAAFLDPNPVVMLEHKGCIGARCRVRWKPKQQSRMSEYAIPLGVSRIVQTADADKIKVGETAVIITYGMGVYWAKAASKMFPGKIEILDLRTLNPIDWDAITNSVKVHGRAFVLTEEPLLNSFAESLAGRISKECFQFLDAPVWTLGAANLPAIPLNVDLEKMMLPNPEKVSAEIEKLLNY
jgi:2-oxoisovalerate dehydrogenase E1 component